MLLVLNLVTFSSCAHMHTLEFANEWIALVVLFNQVDIVAAVA